jgi:predicted MFS family arabinose efflux permease
MPLVAQGAIDGFGWLIAIFVLAAICGSMVPLAFGLRRVDRLPRPAAVEQSIGGALREAGGHSGFWLLNAGFFVCGFHVIYITIHLPSYLTHLGFEPALGALAISIVGIVNMFGSIGAGFLGDRMRKKVLLSAQYFLRSVAIAVFILSPPSVVSVVVFAVTMGSVWLGTVPVTGALVGQIFGPRHMATLFGIVMFSHQIGAFFGAWIGGIVFDATGSYDIAWMIAIGLGLAATALHLPIADEPLRLEESAA